MRSQAGSLQGSWFLDGHQSAIAESFLEIMPFSGPLQIEEWLLQQGAGGLGLGGGKRELTVGYLTYSIVEQCCHPVPG